MSRRKKKDKPYVHRRTREEVIAEAEIINGKFKKWMDEVGYAASFEKVIPILTEEYVNEMKEYFLTDVVDDEFLPNSLSDEDDCFWRSHEEIFHDYFDQDCGQISSDIHDKIIEIDPDYKEICSEAEKFDDDCWSARLEFDRDWFADAVFEESCEWKITDKVAEKFSPECIMYLLRKNPNYREKFREMELEQIRRKELTQSILNTIPKDITRMFPEARRLKRKFVLHIGPTNSGKTHDALEALKKAKHGVYLAPLRLLAFEIYEKMTEAGIPCDMETGEEHIQTANAAVHSMTVELLKLSEHYEVAVIDEAQMISDPDRGGAWTSAILGVQADEIHVCMSADAEYSVIKLIQMCGDEFEIVRYERKVPLVADETNFMFPDSVQAGDALIVFGAYKVMHVAAELQEKGIRCSVIYGNLPYETRHNEVRRFVEGETDVIVATDAIGMGMNIPIKRVVFLETSKFDGHEVRSLKPAEVKQIAGRAGRYGKADCGYYTAEFGLKNIIKKYEDKTVANPKIILDFPETLLSVVGSLTETIREWKNIPVDFPFEKAETGTMYEIASRLEKYTDDKRLIYRFATLPVDIKSQEQLDILMKTFYKVLGGGVPGYVDYWVGNPGDNLQEMQEAYKLLSLIYVCLRRFGNHDDLPTVMQRKKALNKAIMKYLESHKFAPKRCRVCGKVLSWNFPYKLCEECHDEMYGGYGYDYW